MFKMLFFVNVLCCFLILIETYGLESAGPNTTKEAKDTSRLEPDYKESPVTNVSYEIISPRMIRLKWTVSKNTDSVHHFVVQFNNDNYEMQLVQTEQTQMNIDDINACVPNKVTIAAQTVANKPVGGKKVVLVPEKKMVSPKPGIRIREIGCRHVRLDWIAPHFEPNCPPQFVRMDLVDVTHGNISITEGPHRVSIEPNFIGSFIGRYPLDSSTNFSATVILINAAGESEKSSEIKFETQKIPYLEDVSYEIFPQGTIRLKFQVPKDIDFPHHFIVEFNNTKNATQRKMTIETQIDIDDLNVCVPNTVVVNPQTVDHFGTKMDVLVPNRTLVPGFVTNLRVSNDENWNVFLNWTPPLEYAACVTSYRIRETKANTSFSESTKNVYYNVTSILKKCVLHSFEVTSVTADGTESAVANIDFFMPKTICDGNSTTVKYHTFNGNVNLLHRTEKLADEVKPNTHESNINLTYTSYITHVQGNSTNITWQDKKINGPEITVLEFATHHLLHSPIKMVVFEEKNKSQLVGDIVVIKTEPTKEVSYKAAALKIKFERNKIFYPDNPNWTCVYWDFNISKWSDYGIRTKSEPDFISCLSFHLSTFSILLPDPDQILFNKRYERGSWHNVRLTNICRIGSWITICFLILVIIINLKRKNGKETRKILINVCFALLLTHITYQIHTFFEGYSKCLIINFMKYYFVLAFLLWTAADGINMWRKLFADVFDTRGHIFYQWYKIISWGLPTITTAIGIFFITSQGNCKLQINKTYDLIFYLIPCTVILCCNMLLFLWMFLNMTNKDKLGRLKDKKIDYVVALTQVFGIGWCVVFPFLYFKSTQLFAEYLLAGVISTQGLLIFIVRGINQNPKKKSQVSPGFTPIKSGSPSSSFATPKISISTVESDGITPDYCVKSMSENSELSQEMNNQDFDKNLENRSPEISTCLRTNISESLTSSAPQAPQNSISTFKSNRTPAYCAKWMSEKGELPEEKKNQVFSIIRQIPTSEKEE